MSTIIYYYKNNIVSDKINSLEHVSSPIFNKRVYTVNQDNRSQRWTKGNSNIDNCFTCQCSKCINKGCSQFEDIFWLLNNNSCL